MVDINTRLDGFVVHPLDLFPSNKTLEYENPQPNPVSANDIINTQTDIYADNSTAQYTPVNYNISSNIDTYDISPITQEINTNTILNDIPTTNIVSTTPMVNESLYSEYPVSTVSNNYTQSIPVISNDYTQYPIVDTSNVYNSYDNYSTSIDYTNNYTTNYSTNSYVTNNQVKTTTEYRAPIIKPEIRIGNYSQSAYSITREIIPIKTKKTIIVPLKKTIIIPNTRTFVATRPKKYMSLYSPAPIMTVPMTNIITTTPTTSSYILPVTTNYRMAPAYQMNSLQIKPIALSQNGIRYRKRSYSTRSYVKKYKNNNYILL